MNSRGNGNNSNRNGGNGRPKGPAAAGDLLAQTERELQDEGSALRLLHHMAVLFDRDRLLQTVTFPLHDLASAVAEYLNPRPEAFQDRSRLEDGLTECAWFVLPGLVTERFVEEVRKHIAITLQRRQSPLDRKALATALILSRLEQTPKELAENGLWNFLFRRSLMELLELPSRELALPLKVKEALRAIPLAALREPTPADEPSPIDLILEEVYHGLEAGYLCKHLGFSYLIRFPFALAVLFPRGSEQPRSDPETEDRLMMATIDSIAREGAKMGVVDEMVRLYREARDAASGDRERHFYASLVVALETFEPEENPLLPALYYEHYLHYLSGEMEKDGDVIRDILDQPLDTSVYDRYAEILRNRNQPAAVSRVLRIRDEVRDWQKQNP